MPKHRRRRRYIKDARMVVGGKVHPLLDGLTGITGAFSFSRKLLSTYGGAFYADNGAGSATFCNDQTAGAHHMAAGGTVPLATGGPNNRACVDFPGTAGPFFRQVGVPMSTFITASAGHIFCTVLPDTAALNDTNNYANNAVVTDTGGYLGMFLKNNASYLAYNYDGSPAAGDAATVAISFGVPLVLEWWHTGGNVLGRVNGVGSGTSVASGNTSDLTNDPYWGNASPTGGQLDGKLFEVIYSNVSQAGAAADAIVANMKAWIGI